jgi:hypothetical protein
VRRQPGWWKVAPVDLISRPYRGDAADDRLIAALLAAQPAGARHLIDQPWRLSCPDTQSGRFARLWQVRGGTLPAFAAWQPPSAALDVFVRPDRDDQRLRNAILAWAHDLFFRLDAERGKPQPFRPQLPGRWVPPGVPRAGRRMADQSRWVIAVACTGLSHWR